MEFKICETCHSTFVPTLAKDVILHRNYHDTFLHGVRANVLKSDNEVFSSGYFRTILVSPESSFQQRKRAERIAVRAKQDTHFDFASYHSDETEKKDSPLVFIGIIKNRAIAMLGFRKTKRTARVTWEHYERKDRENLPWIPDARWKIAMIWTLENMRRKGYAKQLISIASKYIGSPVSEIAWSTPFTEFGNSLAKAIASDEVILTV